MKCKVVLGTSVLILGLVFCGVGIWALLSPARYRASVRVEVEHRSDPGVYDAWFIQTEFELIWNGPILSNVVERLNLFADADGNKVTIDEASHLLQKRVSLRAVGQDIFEISLIDERPQEAARIANAIAEAYRDFKSKHGGSVRIVAPAFPPESAIGPSFLLRAGLLFCGLAMSVAGCCVIFDRWPKTLATGAIRWLLRKKGSPPV